MIVPPLIDLVVVGAVRVAVVGSIAESVVVVVVVTDSVVFPKLCVVRVDLDVDPSLQVTSRLVNSTSSCDFHL